MYDARGSRWATSDNTLCFNTSSTLGHRDLIVTTITCYNIHFLIQALPKSTYSSYLTYAHMDHVTNEYVRFNLLSDNKILFPLWCPRTSVAGAACRLLGSRCEFS